MRPSRPATQKECLLDPKDYTYAKKYRLKAYQDARKYSSVGTMLGAIVIVGTLPVAGGFLLALYLSIMIESIKASLEAVEARLQDEEASERLRPKERLS